MISNKTTLACATVVCLSGIFGLAHAAQGVTSATTAKTGVKATKTAVASKKAKTAKAGKTRKTAATSKKLQPAVAAPVAVAMPAQPTNPYLASQPQNPYLAMQQNNPYLAYKAENTYAAAQPANPANPMMATPVGGLIQLLQTLQPGNAQMANGQSVNPSARKHITFAPLPLDIYMNPGIRPAVAFTTPCVTIAKMTNNFPPIMAFENFMFDNIGKINATEALPFSIEPVCT